MKRRKWTAKEKTMIVLLGIKERQKISDICSDHGISQAQYYQWREQFLNNAEFAFEKEKPSKKLIHLENENEKLKNVVGELMLELKKKGIWA